MTMTSLLTALLLQAVSVTPALETAPVAGLDDAADDTGFWFNEADPAKSLILGTDKRAGLRIYDLTGAEVGFLPVGRLNNVDVVRGVRLADWSGDIAAATNRTDDSVSLFEVDAQGVRQIGAFSVAPEPYGFCMGRDGGALTLFVAHKQGYVQPYRLAELGEPPIATPPLHFATQIEGCVYDETAGALYVGEETRGIWRAPYAQGRFGDPALIDAVGGETGLVADVEGLTLHDGAHGRRLLASSQGEDGYHVYDLDDGHRLLGKFQITANSATGVDGAQDTDGVEAVAHALPGFPEGIFIAQDGYNVDGLARDGRTPDEERLHPQNFKIVDWRDVERVLPARPQ